MKKSITPLFFVFSLFCTQVQAKDFASNGFTFTHSDDLNTKVTGDAVKTIVAKNDKGIQFLVQNYKALITPDKLQTLMVSSLMKKFGDKSTLLKNKTVVRPLLGKKREGSYIMIVEQNIPMECVVFTFKEGDNTYCVMTQQPLKDSPEAEKYFSEIQATLKAAE